MGKKMTLDWNDYIETARAIVAEGSVLLKNEREVLPLKEGTRVSVFGRIQLHYYKSGTGSGGMVNVSEVVGILDGLRREPSIQVNEQLADIYQKWDEENPFDEGIGWGNEPWSQKEMPLTDVVAEKAASLSDAAVVVLGRTAGEDRDASDTPGSYRLTDTEEEMLACVRRHFDKMIVLLNVGGIIDMGFVDTYQPEAVLYVWQGGMIGGLGVADMLCGKAAPSGKLTDTIAYRIEDYPSSANFGGEEYNCYCEDIYVGYRYFETFAKEKVRYPFGFGLTYTQFDIQLLETLHDEAEKELRLTVQVTNTGKRAGKEVVQVYGQPPQGMLGKPFRTLLDFAKTEELMPGEVQEIAFVIPDSAWASYDDSGVTGYPNCFLLEAGEYCAYVGNDVRTAKRAGSFVLSKTVVTEKLCQALAPVRAFERIRPVLGEDGTVSAKWEAVPLAKLLPEERRLQRLPRELVPEPGDEVYRLLDVRQNKISMDRFVAQLSDEDLACIVRGEGMGSSRVTPGTAAAFCGVSTRLVQRFGIPSVCCDDGPSGMRLDSGAKAFSMPNGTMMGCTFHPELIEKMYAYAGTEMLYNQVDCLLGPGMNIHRHPLNGRNFEYFSEDPYVTGMIAMAQLRGLRSVGATGTMKHFCGNNQEFHRHDIDSVISERALREIYLKAFEMAVRQGVANAVMTTYGSVNGLWTAGQYDLNTTILREEWGYKGIVMSDWWAKINERNGEANHTNFGAMVRAQNDIYMVCPDGETNASNDNTLEALAAGDVTRAELQRCAMNICGFVLETEAMRRLAGEQTVVEIINRPDEEEQVDLSNIVYQRLGLCETLSLEKLVCKADSNHIIPFDVETPGMYEVTLTGSSDLSELAQLPCTLFVTGILSGSYTFHGTAGKPMSITRKIRLGSRFSLMRLYVGRNGLKLHELHIKYAGPLES